MTTPPEPDYNLACPECGSKDTRYITTHFDINSDNEVSEYRCNSCAVRFAD